MSNDRTKAPWRATDYIGLGLFCAFVAVLIGLPLALLGWRTPGMIVIAIGGLVGGVILQVGIIALGVRVGMRERGQ